MVIATVVGVVHCLAGVALVAATASAAGEEHQDGGKESQDCGHESNVGGRTICGIADAVIVDLVAEEGEGDEVDDDGNGGDDECDERDNGRKDGNGGAVGGNGQEEGEEEGAGADGMEDEHPRQSLDGVAAPIAIIPAVDVLDDPSRVIAEGGVGATEAFRALFRAIAKYTKFSISARWEIEADEGDGFRHRGGNVNHDGEDHGDEEQSGADIVKSFTDGHVDGLFFFGA